MTENEIARHIVDAAFWVHTLLGPGLLESVYERVLMYELQKRGLRVRNHVPIPVIYDEIHMEEGFRADQIVEENLPANVRAGEDAHARRNFVLRVIQPGLAGLMDGSVSTLAPVFAAACATGQSWNAFLVGMAASIGAGISMAFAEALSDNGSLTGRGAPVIRPRRARARLVALAQRWPKRSLCALGGGPNEQDPELHGSVASGRGRGSWGRSAARRSADTARS